MKFLIRVETATNAPEFSGCTVGQKYITGCANNRAAADRLFGPSGYYAVYADSSHQVRREAERAGFLK